MEASGPQRSAVSSRGFWRYRIVGVAPADDAGQHRDGFRPCRLQGDGADPAFRQRRLQSVRRKRRRRFRFCDRADSAFVALARGRGRAAFLQKGERPRFAGSGIFGFGFGFGGGRGGDS